MKLRSLGLLAGALSALAFASAVQAQTLTSLPLKDATSTTQNECIYNDGTRFYACHLLFGWTGSAAKAWDVDANGFGHVVVESPTLPTGAATQATLAAVLAALNTPLQAGGAVSVSNLPATQPVSATALPLPAGAATAALQGTIVAAETSNVFFASNTTPLTGAATFTGTTRDVGVAAGTGTAVSYFNAIFYADQAGTAYIDVSDDGTTWTPAVAGTALTASTPLTLTAPLLGRYYRARLVNGATAQTVLRVSSAFSRN